MTPTVKLISGLGFTPATPQDVERGLRGYLTFTIADLLLVDGVTLRVTEAGRHTLSFPSRTDKQGRRHPYFRPLDDRVRCIIEKTVLDMLGIPAEAKEGRK